MKPVSKLYLKTFLVMGNLFALSTTITDVSTGHPFSIQKFLFLGLIFGGSMSLILVTIHKNSLKAIGITEPTEEELKPTQQAEFISETSKSDFIKRLSQDKIYSKMKLSKKDAVINLKSGYTWKSFGEAITIRINESATDTFKYQVESKPKLPMTLIDYGKNLENILRIKELANTTS